MARWSWRPGLPSLGSKYDLWAIDANPAGKEIHEFQYLLLVVADGEAAELLTNLASAPTALDGKELARVDHEKEYTVLGGRRMPITGWTLGGRRMLVKRWRLVEDGEKELPENIQGKVLPPRRFNQDDIERLAEELA